MKNVNIHITLISLITLVTSGQLFSQSMNADSLYTTARSQAYAQQYDSAVANLRVLLANHPERYDAHLLLCSIYSWEREFEQARAAYQVILKQYPTVEVYRGAGRVEMWDAAWADALTIFNQGLSSYPGDTVLTLLKAQTLAQLGRTEEGIILLEDMLPSPQADSLLHELRPQNAKNAIRASYYYANFDEIFTPWHIGSLEYERRTKLGPVIARVSRARMFDQIGQQAELDFYPKIASRTYAYLNFGISDRTVFPNLRWGGEIFQGVGASTEISGGMRMLYFEPATVRIYTAQLGHYAGSHWISARGFLTNIQEASNAAGAFTYRRYIRHSDQYFSLYANYGNAPIQVVSLPEILRVNTQRLGIDYKHAFWQRTLLVRLMAEYQWEEYVELRQVNRWGLEFGLEKRF
ncbi:YaiO family outer membrane beta-barrel protein [Tunicatimonas pelagia]|uniref:YaiO family outer membrane beta-barrel protein n=1 Tax=Tunicatimonas pelagia TaxID=931531 RepID=UPI0026664F71|nr:YaiO family outer membrane beta-barrel protein [Tunicatimonas pelagia]WKN45856.1 YaiO family outer membrane beta-barrel protein [Tunicatimonas pelagia]